MKDKLLCGNSKSVYRCDESTERTVLWPIIQSSDEMRDLVDRGWGGGWYLPALPLPPALPSLSIRQPYRAA